MCTAKQVSDLPTFSHVQFPQLIVQESPVFEINAAQNLFLTKRVTAK